MGRRRVLQDLLARLVQQLEEGRFSAGGRLLRLCPTFGGLEEILAPRLVHRGLRQRLGHDGRLAELEAVTQVDHGMRESDKEA